MRDEKSESQSGDEIVRSMRDDAGAKAAAEECEQAEESAEDSDEEHGASAFIRVGRAEDER